MLQIILSNWASPGDSDSKESARIAGDLGSIPELGRSTGEGEGYSVLTWNMLLTV